METPSIGAISASILGIAVLVLIAIGAPYNREVEAPPVPTASPPPSVSGGGFTLASVSVDLPIDDLQYPDGPYADVINANCTSCHSASMALFQPPLTTDQWKATVSKMREVYKAPVAEKDIAAIVDYLTAMSSGQADAAIKLEVPGGEITSKLSANTG